MDSQSVSAGGANSASRTTGRGLVYPPARKCNQVDDFHGTRVPDPYRWLEDVDSAETHEWIEAQNKLTGRYIAGIQARDQIRKRLAKLCDYMNPVLAFPQHNREQFEAHPNSAAVIKALTERKEARYEVLGGDEVTFHVFTTDRTSHGRVVAIDMRRPEPRDWIEILPQREDILECAALAGDLLFASYRREARSDLRIFGLDGVFRGTVELPGVGSVLGLSGTNGDPAVCYSFQSLHTPSAVYRYNPEHARSELCRRSDLSYDPGEFETVQVFCRSRDRSRIPMFLACRKGLERSRSNPVLLYGYGGYQRTLVPAFYPQHIAWMEMGGIYAQAGIRGGGEYGRNWHWAGRGRYKQNSIDDFIAAAEWLVSNRYTSPSRLAIRGDSNGGLLIGACLTQRPDLFGAALAWAGPLDMLRFHTTAAGLTWKSEYGYVDRLADFRDLYAYSPLHNVKKGAAYPPTLIATAIDDEVVAPWHSFKFAAALQAAQRGPGPVLIRTDPQGGHTEGATFADRIDSDADELAFLCRAFEIAPPEGDS